jgi:HEPN domain-containing protein
MPRENKHLKRSREWLRYARSDLALAQAPKTRRILYQHLCFHAQQASEKAIKAVLIAHGVSYPPTHDLAYLLDLMPQSVTVPVNALNLPILTKYAVQHRYPGETRRITMKQYLRALELAEEAITWAAAELRRGSGSL